MPGAKQAKPAPPRPPGGPVADPLLALQGYRLRRASAASMAELADRLRKLELRPSEASVLLVVRGNPGITPGEAGRLLGIASANFAPLAARLARRGWLSRVRRDGRSQRLILSPSGRRLARESWRIMEGLDQELLARIPARQRAHFHAVLRALTPA